MKNKENRLNMWQYLKKYKGSIGFYLLLYTIGSVCFILITIFIAQTIEMITLKFYTKAIYTFLIIIGLYCMQGFCFWYSGVVYQKCSAKIMLDLNYDLARQSFKLNSKTFADHDTGTFVQRIVNDPQIVVTNLSEIVDSVTDLLTSFVIFVYIATLNIWISLLLITLVVFCSTLETFRIRYRRKARKTLRKKSDKVHSITTEIVRSEKDIKSIGLEEKLSEISRESYEDYKRFSNKTEIVDMNFYNFRTFVINIAMVAILILGITFIDKGLISLAAFMIVYSNRTSIFSVVWGFGRIGNMIADIRISNDRMFALFDNKEFVCEKFGNATLEDFSGGGKVEFRNVGYTFYEHEFVNNDNEKGEEEKQKKKKNRKKEIRVVSQNRIFNDLSFTVEPNTTVAFVGKSGSGKSTILNLMSKMYEVENGEVLINGININDLTKESLRKTISLVNQFPYIFDMTIKENLMLAKRNATQEELDKALADSSLNEFVVSLPNKLDTKVGESGIKLSGGQKQRLAIARALLRNSAIIIFDESTSSLDNFAQGHIKKSIDNLKGKATVVIVAHRLSTIKDVDKIFFLDNGQIIDEGTFEELFEKNNTFKTMFLAENI